MLTLLLAGLVLAVPAVHAESCPTLEACLAKYPSVATTGPGIGAEENALAHAVQRYGAAAVPSLIKLLESGQENVRILAGYTLRDIDGLKPEHLPALMKARKNGDGWIPPAIASVGTPEAIEFLVKDLHDDPEIHTQVTWALESLGAKAAGAVARLLRCSEHCDEHVFLAANFVLSQMKEQAAATIPFLLDVAGDDKLAMSSRQSATLAIGDIGSSAQSYVPQLLNLRTRVPALATAVDATLADIGTTEAVPSLLNLLAVDPASALRKLAKLGKNGFTAGPQVISYLGNDRWDLRIGAAKALGRIGYAPAEPALRKALEDRDDWKLVYAAALALARLKSGASIEALRQVQGSHWYPPVRDVARSAIAHVASGAPLKEPVDPMWEYAEIEGSPKSCIRVPEPAAKEPADQKLHAEKQTGELLELALSNRGDGESSGDVPSVALKVTDGWLTGTDHGGWGGQLIYQPTGGAKQILAEENTQNIFLLGRQIVAVSGLAHLSMNNGMLLRIDRDGRGGYAVRPWKRLPAAPETSWMLEGGAMLVNTFEGGSVIIDTAGNLRMADCL